MAKIIGVSDTSNQSFNLQDWLMGTLSGLSGSAGEQIDKNLSIITERINVLFGGNGVAFNPAGLVANTNSRLAYMMSGRASDASLGMLEIKGSKLPTYDAVKGNWTAMPNPLTIASIGYTNGSDTVNGERFYIEGALSISHPTLNGAPTDKLDFSISKISIGNSDILLSLLADRFRIIAQTYEDGTAVADPVVSGTLKSLQLDLANDGGIYDHVVLGFTLGASNANSPYLLLNSLVLTEDGSKTPLLSLTDAGIKIQKSQDATVITRGTTTWDQQGEIWDFVFGGADSIQGTIDNDSLDGGMGNDTLVGLDGDDFYYVNTITDVVTENTGAGYDTIISSAQTYTMPANVERLMLDQTMTSGFSHQDGIGNAAKNTLVGNALNNYLYGKDGHDTLTGGDGADQFIFDTKPKASTNVDTITDFVPDEDVIRLSAQYFKQFAGANNGYFFAVAGVDATTAGTRIIYDENKGYLYYDADGSKVKSKPVLFAKLVGAPHLDGTMDSTYFSFFGS